MNGQMHSISPREIEHFFSALTQFPERRARSEVDGLEARLSELRQHAETISARPDSAPVSADVIEDLCGRHTTATRAYWAAEGRCMNWFVTGPSNFPVARNQKRMETAHKRSLEVTAHLQAAKRRVERIAFPHGLGDAIRSADPDAIDKLRLKLAETEALLTAYKAANAAIRKDDWAAVAAAVGQERADSERAFIKRWGYGGFNLANRRAEIHRITNRVAALERMQARGTVESEPVAGIRMVENAEAARLQLIFPGKPDNETRSILKSHGFRWAPSEGAWQRHLNNGAKWAAQQVLAKLNAEAPDHQTA